MDIDIDSSEHVPTPIHVLANLNFKTDREKTVFLFLRKILICFSNVLIATSDNDINQRRKKQLKQVFKYILHLFYFDKK